MMRDRSKNSVDAGRRWVIVRAVFMLCFTAVAIQSIFAQKYINCIECHQNLDKEYAAPVKALAKSIHARYGISCADCHGGVPDIRTDNYEVAMDPKKGFKGAPSPPEIPEFCGKCHSDAEYMKRFDPNLPTDQLAQYRTSKHGILIMKGDKKVASCVSCHDSHDVLSVKDPLSPVYRSNVAERCAHCHANKDYMAEYGIATNQYEKYRKSIHWTALYKQGDLSAATCNNCHGNHGPIPPKALSIGNICGQCHFTNWEMFSKSPHKKAFDAAGIPECEVCHGNHEILKPEDEMIGTSGKAVCILCHTKGDGGYKAAEEMRNFLEELKSRISGADEIVKKVASSGMEVSDASFDIKEAENQLVKSRTLIHTFDPQEVRKSSDEGIGIAQKALEIGKNAISELQFRRKGLAVSLFFIVIVACILYFKIRRSRRISAR